MRCILHTLILFCLLQTSLSAQMSADKIPSIAEEIAISAKNGNKRALRDLGTLLNQPIIQNQVKLHLEQLIFTTPEEFDFNKSFTRSDFLDFYYREEKSLEYSELLNAWFITSLNNQKVSYQSRENAQKEEQELLLQLREQKNRFIKLVERDNVNEISLLIDSIADGPQGEGYRFLLEQLENKNLLSFDKSQSLLGKVTEKLSQYHALESFQAVMLLLKKKRISPEQGARSLARLCNVNISSYANEDEVYNFYQSLLDSLSTITDLRQYGYESRFSFQPNFFAHPVDYYGKVLNESSQTPWIVQNAVEDLINTGHPRALFYLATQVYKYRDTGGKHPDLPNLSFEQLLQNLTHLDIGLKDKNNLLHFSIEGNTDNKLTQDFIRYWSSHYKDYEWDEHHRYFTNKYKAEELTQNYERLFRRLNSQNDSVAKQSFVQLTLGDPIKIAELSDKYRNLLRSYNPSLPPLKFYYLEQLSKLTEFCREHNIPYEPGRTLAQKINRLRTHLSQQDRYKLENELIRTLSFKDVTVLEYQSCLNENNLQFSQSVGRILDWFYSKHWHELLSNDQHLLLYLKKSQLFSEIGVYGSCNSYLNKFDLNDPTLYSRLEQVASITVDEGILNQMSQLVPISDDQSYTIGLEEFLENPLDFNRNDIKILPNPSLIQIDQLFTSIKTEVDPEVIRQYLYFLRLHIEIEQTPQLFELLQDERPIGRRDGNPVPLGDYIVPFLEDIFQYKFPIDPSRKLWLAKWEKDKATYVEWGSQFLSIQLDILRTRDRIKVTQLNDLITSPNFKSIHKENILKLLPRLKPFRDIRKLRFESSLSLETDLAAFQAFSLSYKELDDIPNLFNITQDNTPVILNYLKEKSDRFSVSEKGSFYNNLFRAEWFLKYLTSLDKPNDHTIHILKSLVSYLEESEFLSEFQEQVTYRHMASLEYLGLTLFEQLAASVQLDADPGSKMKIQESILAKIQYEDLGSIAPLIEELSTIPGKNPFNFLQKDFGLPIFDLDKTGALKTLIEQHKTMSQKDFYIHYLEEFGLQFRNSKGELDFNAIYNILQFDLVTPFVSRSGGQRDHYIYGLVKVLELHFDTSLGYHKKLNENQTFYTYTSAKRALSWMKYLQDEHLVEKARKTAPSFSQLKQ